MLSVGRRTVNQSRNAEEKVQALRCIANLASSIDAKPALANSGAIGMLLDVFSGEAGLDSAKDVEWRMTALKVLEQLCPDDDFRADMDKRDLVSLFQQNPVLVLI